MPEWIDYWASLKLDGLLLNGGGILAFYPTQVPYHHRSEFLGTRDLFGELSAAAKARGMRVVARMDCNYAYKEALDAHPEWFERNRDGSPRPHGESPWLFKTCMFSPYFTEQMPAIYREINSRYQVDGFFTNGWPSTGSLTVCSCESCQRVYRTIGGTPPPETDATNLTYRRFYDASMERIQTVWTSWQRVVTEGGRESVYVGNLGGGIRTVKNVRQLAEAAAWFNADHQGRSSDTPIWDCAQQGRVAQAVMEGRAITNVTGAYSNSQPTWRHVAKAPAETVMWMAQTTASGMVPWFHWLGGSPEDTRWKATGHDFYTWLAANEPHFRNTRSVANLAVLYPQRTIAFYRSGSRDRVPTSEYLQGLYYALLEGRFLFDFIHEDQLSADRLRKYKALLVPNAAYLDDEPCQAIRAYVRSGGSLLATFESSRYNGWGEPRPDFALSDVFGARADGALIGPLGNSYMRIDAQHPILEGFDGTALLPGPESRVPIRSTIEAPPALTVVPNYPAFPPEMVFPRTPRTDSPAAVLHEAPGAGRVAYFAGDVDRTAWRSGNVDLSRLLQNTVDWLIARQRPVTIDGDGIVESFAWQTKPGYALHLLNYTNPNMTRGSLRRFYPVGVQDVGFAIQRGQRVTAVRALRADQPLTFRQEDSTVRFELPSVVDYEVIALTVA
ncbi:MAG TPA: beta-galactosidase trimerization domain-containing protein, partial [Vicinamibacterales bacterium]